MVLSLCSHRIPLKNSCHRLPCLTIKRSGTVLRNKAENILTSTFSGCGVSFQNPEAPQAWLSWLLFVDWCDRLRGLHFVKGTLRQTNLTCFVGTQLPWTGRLHLIWKNWGLGTLPAWSHVTDLGMVLMQSWNYGLLRNSDFRCLFNLLGHIWSTHLS